jgi:hypothetical protein
MAIEQGHIRNDAGHTGRIDHKAGYRCRVDDLRFRAG